MKRKKDGLFARDTEKNAEMQAIKPLITSLTILGASREIQYFLQIRTFGDGQVPRTNACQRLSTHAK